MKKEKKEIFKYIGISLLVLVLLFALGYFIFSVDYSSEDNTLFSNINPEYDFDNLDLEAKAVSIFRIKTGETLYSLNENLQLPLASLSKTMTALTAYESHQNPNNTVVIMKENLKTDGESGLKERERWKLKNLIDFTLIVSSNDGANAVASAIEGFKMFSSHSKDMNFNFIDKMNDIAEKIGLSQTYFINESGLDIDERYQSGSYGSAKDMTKLFDYIVKYRPEILEATTYNNLLIKSEDGLIHNATNTNEIINDIPWIIASKTGFTDLAGGNLVVIFDNGLMDPIIISVLGSTQEGRFEDVNKIIEEIIK